MSGKTRPYKTINHTSSILPDSILRKETGFWKPGFWVRPWVSPVSFAIALSTPQRFR
ncbi:hypothetical protein [Microseira wollei]|uniref:hypothetical protein n=1 Tax=Microseira wollei TaxID=467598 RepID=UPI001CFE7CC2|nr:hypothetical protein [Microseira wollei]